MEPTGPSSYHDLWLLFCVVWLFWVFLLGCLGLFLGFGGVGDFWDCRVKGFSGLGPQTDQSRAWPSSSAQNNPKND